MTPPQQESITSTITIAQSNLPSIAFTNNTTVDIPLNADGNGIFEFQSLMNDGTITIANQGSNNLRFELDRSDTQWDSVNAGTNGVISTNTFTIPTFSENHTVLYNGTHLAFHFDDPTYRGTTPSLPLQASLHVRAADQYPNNPFVDVAIGNTSFTFIDPPPPPLCQTTIGAVSLDFGNIRVGVTTNLDDDGTIEIVNSGSMNAVVNIGAYSWCIPTGCVVGDIMTTPMINTQTRYHMDMMSYVGKTSFEVIDYTMPIPDTPPLTNLFSIPPNSDDLVYLQVEVALRDIPNIEQNRFTGDVTQEIVVDSECDTS